MSTELICHLLDIPDRGALALSVALGAELRLLNKSGETDSYSLHRLVGEVRRAEIPPEGRVEWVATICKRIGDWFEGKRKDYLQLTRFESEIDHLNEWQENAARYASVHSSRLMWLQAYPHYHRAQYAAASNYLTDAWRIFEQLESGDRELKANLINDLTVTSGELGTLFSVPEPTEALSIRQELFGELHPDVANSLNTLSHWYGGQGDLETALD